MNPGDVILIDFPFTIPTQSKIRPAVVLTVTQDKYKDIVICAVSSVVPAMLTPREILISSGDPSFPATGLRVDSVIKMDRIATLRTTDVIAKLGHCPPNLWDKIVAKFRTLV
jgi:mRNA interferase MazF